MTDRIVGAFTHWAKLKKVLVGSMHPSSYFDEITDAGFRDRMKHINDETIEDLENLSKLLRDNNVEVHRTIDVCNKPGVYSTGNLNVVNPRSPYTPRDFCDFVDNKMLGLLNDNQPVEWFNDYSHHDLFKNFAKQGAQWHQMPKGHGNDFDEFDYDDEDYPQNIIPIMNGSNITKMGNVFYYSKGGSNNQMGIDWYKNVVGDKVTFKQYKDKTLYYAHVDSRIHIIRPGLFLSENPKDVVVKNVPELGKWDCIHLPTGNQAKIDEYYGKSEHHFSGEYGGNYNVKDWTHSWLSNWVDDDVVNTNFNINVISVDDNTVILPEANTEYQKLLEKHKVDSVVSRLRHRLFWGHGLNCFTADILREDECIDYFE